MTPNHEPSTPTTPIPDRLLTPAEVAAYCHISAKTVLRAIRAGRLRASRLGARGAYRMRMQDVDAWIGATTVPISPNVERSSTPLMSDAFQLATNPATDRRVSAGRLVLTSDMGRPR